MMMADQFQTRYRFDGFTLDVERRLLTDDSRSVVDITPKAAEILCLLVENAGQLVTKEEVIKRVWADSFVEEANLSHHIFRLRKALGETEDRKLIETVPKRGYRFVGDLRGGDVSSEREPLVYPPPTSWRIFAAAGGLLLIVV